MLAKSRKKETGEEGRGEGQGMREQMVTAKKNTRERNLEPKEKKEAAR